MKIGSGGLGEQGAVRRGRRGELVDVWGYFDARLVLGRTGKFGVVARAGKPLMGFGEGFC